MRGLLSERHDCKLNTGESRVAAGPEVHAIASVAVRGKIGLARAISTLILLIVHTCSTCVSLAVEAEAKGVGLERMGVVTRNGLGVGLGPGAALGMSETQVFMKEPPPPALRQVPTGSESLWPTPEHWLDW